MIRNSRFVVRLFGTACLSVATIGCSLAPKFDNAGTSKGMGSRTASNNSISNLFQFKRTSNQEVVSATMATGTADFSTSDKLKDPVKVHLACALWHEQEGNLVEARNCYKKALESNSKSVDSLLGLARLDIAISRMDDAEARLKKAQKIAPKSPQVAVAYGQFYSARRDWPRALEQMKMARELAPDDTACAYHLGYVQAKSGHLEAALKNFEEAVGTAEAQYNLGYILYEQGNIVAAEEHLQKAISIKPDLPQAQSLLLTVREKHYGTKTQVAKRPAARSSNEFGSGIQQASHTETTPSSR